MAVGVAAAVAVKMLLYQSQNYNNIVALNHSLIIKFTLK